MTDLEEKEEKRTPPENRKNSLQMTMFSSYLTNDDREVSNTIELWESIPKYFLTSVQMEKLRSGKGLAEPYEMDYVSNDRSYSIEIQPALIKQKNGKYKAFFPSASEGLIEEVLKKIFTEQNLGLHEVKKVESWVRFSLRMIYRELKKRGKTRDLAQIKHSIDVMSKCQITVFQEGKRLFRGAILSDLIPVDRDAYEDNPNAHWITRLPVFISHAINTLQYRQFNYSRYMECKEQLTRWLYKRLITRFKQASITTEYHFMFLDLKQSSGLLQMTSTQGNRRKVIYALNELVEREIILKNYAVEERKEGRKIVDIKYTVKATPEFIQEQKAANKRYSNGYIEAEQGGFLDKKL